MNDDEHPLLLHIHSLSTALNVQLSQAHHHALAASRAHSQSRLLSHQLSILNHELTTLRAQASSLPPSTDSSIKINQLSLALRTLSEKLELTERLLVERTRQLDHASVDVSAAKSAMDSAHNLTTRMRTREEELLLHQTYLQTQLHLEEEKSRMNERVIQDYAALVRKLEGRKSSLTPHTKDEQPALKRLSEEFHSKNTNLQHQLSTCQHDLSILQTQLDAQIKTNKDLISQLSQLQVEMDKHERDDNTASKMVSRYMKFSQQSTNTLQTTLTSLQSRHTSTLTSYTSQIHLLQNQLSTLTTSHQSLDHLHTQLLKESFGRRQETKFRLRLLNREEKLVEDLKRWLRKSEERLFSLTNQPDSNPKIYLMEMIQDAKIIIDNLDNPIQINVNDAMQLVSGSLARFVTVQSTVHDLLERLHYEQGRRMELEKLVVLQDEDGFGKDSVGDQEAMKEPMEPATEPFSSYNDQSAEPTAHIPTPTPPGGEGEQGRLVVRRDGDDDEGGFSSANNTPITPTDIGSELKVKLEERKDSVGEQDPMREPTNPTTERTSPPSSSYTRNTNDHLEATHMQTSIPSRGESESGGTAKPEERKENVVIIVEDIDSAKGGEKVIVDEEMNEGPITQLEKETDNSPPAADLAPSSLSEPPSSNQAPPHPLLSSLHHSQNRYTHIQKAFHSCHIALENLKSHLLLTSSSSDPNDIVKNTMPYNSLRTVVQRLDDYTEDIRVELEIRVLDEEVLRRGYETLLSMHSGVSEGEWNEEEILAFVNGTDPIIAKAVKNFEGKLRDLEEDVAVVKKVVFSFDDVVDDNNNPDGNGDNDNDKREKMISTPESLSTDTLVASPTPGWISSWISPSRSTTPTPQDWSSSSSSNLTFGNIMTNRPRKMSSASTLSTPSSSSLSNSILRRTVSSLGLSSSSHDDDINHHERQKFNMHSKMMTGDVIKILQLKTAMPELLVNGSSDREDEQHQELQDYNTRLIPQFSNLGSITPITTITRSSSFALGMGMGMIGVSGVGSRGRGALGMVRMDERRRRVVSAAAGSGMTSTTTILKRIVDVGDQEGGKEDVD